MIDALYAVAGACTGTAIGAWWGLRYAARHWDDIGKAVARHVSAGSN